jgi:molybdate transport system substrate-binding protein
MQLNVLSGGAAQSVVTALAGLLPREFELATVYSAGLCAGAAAPAAARRFIELLTGEASRALRMQAGFEL